MSPKTPDNATLKPEGRRLRVLYVEYGADFGGAVISLAEIVNQADAMNVDPRVLTFQRPDVHRALFGETHSWVHRRLIDYRSRAVLGARLANSDRLKWLRRAVMKGYALADFLHEFFLSWIIFRLARREEVDLIHCNNGIERSALRASAWAGIKCVAHLRAVVTERTAQTVRQHHDLMERAFAGAIAVSSWVYETGLQNGLRSDQMVTIHNPVDPSVLDSSKHRGGEVRRSLGLDDGHVAFGCFGRVNRFKGQKEFLEAARTVAEEVSDARFVIVGDPSDSADRAYWLEVQAMATEGPLAGRVIFAGYQEDVYPFFHACDAVVHSALGAEGFGRVVVEGMACGKPVVATDLGGPKDIVTPGVEGFLVQPGAVTELGTAMLRLASDPVLRTRMGKAGRTKVETEFSSRFIAAKVGHFYARVMASTPQPRPIPS